MSIPKFIGASSAILLAWLGVTYFHEVPVERYQKQGKFSATSSVKSRTADEAVAVTTTETELESR